MNTAKVLFSLIPLFVAAALMAQSSPSVPAKKVGSQTAAKPRVPPLQVGAVAPDFVSNDLAGKPVRLSDWKGKVVVLDFWATWCGPCRRSLPHTQNVAKQFKDQGVVVLACCTSDTRAKFEEWVKANGSAYPDVVFTCDPKEKGAADYAERASNKLYKVSGIPTQFVIGRDGKVAAALVGYSDGDSRLEESLAKIGIKRP